MSAVNNLPGFAQGVVTGTDVSPGTTRLVEINHGGETMYWIVFGFFSLSAIAIAALTFRKLPSARAHGYCTAAILTTAACAYYSMATQGGYAYVRVYSEANTARQIYYARYVDWAITTPLLLLDILLLAGLPVGDTLWIIFADIGMIVTGLFGALLPNRYKWGWFGIGCLFMVLIMWGLLFHARRAAFLRSKKIGATFSFLSVYLLALWWIYPICWGLAEGSNTISSEAEAIFYGCLDLMTKFVFGWMIFLMAEPVVSKQRGEDEARHGGPMPSVLGSPVNWPFLGAGSALTGAAAGAATGAAAGTATKRRMVQPNGAETPVAEDNATGPAGNTTAHEGPALAHGGGTGPVTAHAGGVVNHADGPANV